MKFSVNDLQNIFDIQNYIEIIVVLLDELLRGLTMFIPSYHT